MKFLHNFWNSWNYPEKGKCSSQVHSEAPLWQWLLCWNIVVIATTAELLFYGLCELS